MGTAYDIYAFMIVLVLSSHQVYISIISIATACPERLSTVDTHHKLYVHVKHFSKESQVSERKLWKLLDIFRTAFF